MIYIEINLTYKMLIPFVVTIEWPFSCNFVTGGPMASRDAQNGNHARHARK